MPDDGTAARGGSVPARARPSPAFDVVGIGNALVDVIAHAGDAFLAEHALVKGSMDADRHRPGRRTSTGRSARPSR